MIRVDISLFNFVRRTLITSKSIFSGKKFFGSICGMAAILLCLAFTSCTVGLGAAVDTSVPVIEFSAYPPADAKIRGEFTVGGTWNDDGIIKSIKLVITDLSDPEKKIGKEITNVKNDDKTWGFVVNPFSVNKADPSKYIEGWSQVYTENVTTDDQRAALAFKTFKDENDGLEKYRIPDGTYEMAVTITDSYGHYTKITRQ